MGKDQIGIKTPEFVSLQFQLAGLGSRAAAVIIDYSILTIVNIVIFLSFIFMMHGGSESFFFFSLNAESFFSGIVIIILFLLQWGYFVFMEYFTGGRTIGKKIIGIRVIRENGHGITFLSSIIRNLLRIIDILPFGYFIGMVMVFFHPKHKRIGDLVGGTIVVHERKKKGKKKMTPIEKEIEKRGIVTENYPVEDWALKSIEEKDWNLLKTYSERFPSLSISERYSLTGDVAKIVFPKVGWDITGKTNEDLENGLLALYEIVREEWEYDW